MPTLNQLAARIANALNQPGNHDIMERAKDSIKSIYAERIRQSSERHGLDNQLKLSFLAPLKEWAYTEFYPFSQHIIDAPTILATEFKIPTPVRFHNDAPFTYVGNKEGIPYMYIGSVSNHRYIVSTHFPTGVIATYSLVNGHIVVNKSKSCSEVENRNPLYEILIESIWANPEEVIAMYQDIDGQDIELPLPEDMLNSIIQEAFKTEFGIYQKDFDLAMSQGEVPNPQQRNQ